MIPPPVASPLIKPSTSSKYSINLAWLTASLHLLHYLRKPYFVLQVRMKYMKLNPTPTLPCPALPCTLDLLMFVLSSTCCDTSRGLQIMESLIQTMVAHSWDLKSH